MKSLILTFLFLNLFVLFSTAQASDLVSNYVFSTEGLLTKNIKLTCTSDNPVPCQLACNKNDYCESEEPYCLNCAGSTWPFLRLLFTSMPFEYEGANLEIHENTIGELLRDHLIVLLDSKSIFNFYTSAKSEALITLLKSLCPEGSYESAIGVSLNEAHVPKRTEFVSCRTVDGMKFYEVKNRNPSLDLGINNNLAKNNVDKKEGHL